MSIRLDSPTELTPGTPTPPVEFSKETAGKYETVKRDPSEGSENLKVDHPYQPVDKAVDQPAVAKDLKPVAEQMVADKTAPALQPEIAAPKVDQARPQVAKDRPEFALVKNKINEKIEELEGQIAKKPPLKDILANPPMRAMLKDQLAKEYSMENLDFLDRVEKFNKASLEKNPAAFIKEAQDIYKNFISVGSEQQVNISAVQRDAFKDNLDRMVSDPSLIKDKGKDLFNYSREEIHLLIKNDKLRKVYEREDFKQFDRIRTSPLSEKIDSYQDLLKDHVRKEEIQRDLKVVDGKINSLLPNVSQSMADPVLRPILQDVMKKGFVEENFNYLEAAEQLKREPNIQSLEKIYNEYIAEGSLQQINIDAPSRKAIAATLDKLHKENLSPAEIEKECKEVLLKANKVIEMLISNNNLRTLHGEPEFRSSAFRSAALERNEPLRKELDKLQGEREILSNQLGRVDKKISKNELERNVSTVAPGPVTAKVVPATPKATPGLGRRFLNWVTRRK